MKGLRVIETLVGCEHENRTAFRWLIRIAYSSVACTPNPNLTLTLTHAPPLHATAVVSL